MFYPRQERALDITRSAISSLASVANDIQEPENEEYDAIATNIVSVLNNVLEVTSQAVNTTVIKVRLKVRQARSAASL